MNNIGINYESDHFISDYLPLISFSTEKQKNIAEFYILTKAKIFFDKIIGIDIDVEKSQIKYTKLITEQDFSSIKINYFYDNILFDLGKRDSNNKLDFNPKWGVTFDEKCAPILMNYLSPNYKVRQNSYLKYKVLNYSHLNYKIPYSRYGTIDMNGTPIFYYIYFTLQEILDEVKKVNVTKY
ncbi:MAG: hypothetical protein QNJ64_13230 [Crocosphaera sp.]|nr:hypothetical protein [Crocosphaera sp.]